jgi:protein TonB
MMTGYLHALQIATLSTWLSVAGFGTVGIAIHSREPSAPQTVDALDIGLLPENIVLGDDASEAAGEMPKQDVPADPLPSPPELPVLAETEPLPELPDLPEPRPVIGKTPDTAAPAVHSSPRSARASSGKTTSSMSARAKGAGSAGSGMSNASRIAAGHMPSPDYPSYSRRNRQEGTVVVEFTVDSSGKVISAYAKHPSQWNLLNAEAVSTVRSWRFPPGGIMTLQRPIVFQLR